MGSLFRSEDMCLVSMILNAEASYQCVAELGELGLVHFRDLNDNVNAFDKKFVRDIKRCDEMHRQIRFINKEIVKVGIETAGATTEGEGVPEAPLPAEIVSLEESLYAVEKELNELNENKEKLHSNFVELVEVGHVLRKTSEFFNEMDKSRSGGIFNSSATATVIEGYGKAVKSAKVNFVAGTVAAHRISAMEKITWRACRGKVFLHFEEIEDQTLVDVDGNVMKKSVFIAFYQGVELTKKVTKIANGVRATVYPVPEDSNERRDVGIKVTTNLADIKAVIDKTDSHKHKLLSSCAKLITSWHVKVLKAKSVYSVHDMLQLQPGSSQLFGEAWCPSAELENVQNALKRGAEKSGSSIPNIVDIMHTNKVAPTYNKTNKYTEAYQAMVDSYGVSDYKEVNPTPFVIISFPFLFGVMFGDMGHGIVMLLIAAMMIWKERQLKHIDQEMFQMIFGGRYVLILMATFSIYCGFIYNDMWAKSVNFFGTSWKYPHNATLGKDQEFIQLFPRKHFGEPVPYAMDPIWQVSNNRIKWLNSFKMKSAVCMGIMQMFFGLLLSLANHRYFKKPLNIIGEWIPQMIFLCSIFVYLVFTIILKWLTWTAKDSCCAPSLLINLIGIFMLNTPKVCVGQKFKGTPIYLYAGQAGVQKVLILLALIAVPWMLLTKPIVLYRRHQAEMARKANLVPKDPEDEDLLLQNDKLVNHDDEEEEEFEMQEVAIHQIIHTIEFCLNCISHTASYLRLWALSLAHAQLSDVLWGMMLKIGLKMTGFSGVIAKSVIFLFFGSLTVGILIVMEGLSAFLHALRLHWVEFNSKFFHGDGYLFAPFCFERLLETPGNKLGEQL